MISSSIFNFNSNISSKVFGFQIKSIFSIQQMLQTNVWQLFSNGQDLFRKLIFKIMFDNMNWGHTQFQTYFQWTLIQKKKWIRNPQTI